MRVLLAARLPFILEEVDVTASGRHDDPHPCALRIAGQQARITAVRTASGEIIPATLSPGSGVDIEPLLAPIGNKDLLRAAALHLSDHQSIVFVEARCEREAAVLRSGGSAGVDYIGAVVTDNDLVRAIGVNVAQGQRVVGVKAEREIGRRAIAFVDVDPIGAAVGQHDLRLAVSICITHGKPVLGHSFPPGNREVRQLGSAVVVEVHRLLAVIGQDDLRLRIAEDVAGTEAVLLLEVASEHIRQEVISPVHL